MHVLHVITGLGIGGAELMLKRLVIAGQINGRIRHSVVALRGGGEVAAQLQDAGVHVEAIGLHGARDVPGAVLRLRRRIRELRPDVVQTWMYHADLLGGLASRLAGNSRVVWGLRASTMVAGTPRTTLAARWLCARLSAGVPAAIVCAAEATRSVHAAAGYDDSRMVVIPNGFVMADHAPSASAVRQFRRALGWGEDAQVAGTVGRFDPYKDYRTFVAAAATAAAGNDRLRFLMVGRGLDPGNRELASWIDEAGIAGRVKLLGPRSDVPLCLAAMDVFVLSSRSEGFPNVVGEAMAVGVPCVVTNVGDAALLVGSAGVVVPAEDPDALAAGVTTVLAMSAEERAQLGMQGRERIRNNFSMERTLAAFETLYVQVLGAAAVA